MIRVRRTYTQGLLPGAAPVPSPAIDSSAAAASADREAAGTQRDKAGGDHKLVRTDARAQTLDAFISRNASSSDSPVRIAAAAAATVGKSHHPLQVLT